MRIARYHDAQRVDRAVRAAEQRPQIRPAKREIDSLLRPSDDSDPLAVRRHDPDAARSRAIHPAGAVHLEAVGYARLAALIEISEDAASDHVAERVEADRMDVLRGARVRDVHRALVRRQREPVRVFAMRSTLNRLRKFGSLWF